jgi:hypothetical protein
MTLIHDFPCIISPLFYAPSSVHSGHFALSLLCYLVYFNSEHADEFCTMVSRVFNLSCSQAVVLVMSCLRSLLKRENAHSRHLLWLQSQLVVVTVPWFPLGSS